MGRVNQTPLIEVPFNNWGGGYAGAKGATTLKPNEAADLDNIIILPGGGGIRNRNGNTEEAHTGDLSTYINPVQGMIAYKKATTEHLIWLTELGTSGDVTVLEHDLSTNVHTVRKTVTGGDGQDNIFSLFKFKELVIGVSDEYTTPFKIDMSGTPSGGDLGGTPPSGKVGIAWNNVAWIGNTSADPSKLYYSVLNSAEDWSGASSGFVNPQAGDGDELIALAPISNNVMLYFKRHSVFQIVGRADPFAVFPLFQGVGCAGKNACIAVDGLVYFITPQGKFKITDGSRIYDDKDIPAISNADDLWANIPKTRLPYVQAVRRQGTDFDHIAFLVSFGTSQTTNNAAIIWDLKNKCWLGNSTGWNGNSATALNDGTVYIGGYAGRVYKQDVFNKFRDDSEATPTLDGSNNQVVPTAAPIAEWFWRSDHLSLGSLYNIVQVQRVNMMIQYQTSGFLTLSWGYDGVLDENSVAYQVVLAGSAFVLGTSLLGTGILGDLTRYRTRTFFPLGRGQTFNLKISGSSAVATKLTRFTLVGRQNATKIHEVK